jgi:hypothetical protein
LGGISLKNFIIDIQLLSTKNMRTTIINQNILRVLRRYMLAVGLLCILFSIEVADGQATESAPIGIGVLLGEPTGLTLKVWTNPRDAVTFEVGESYFGLPRVQIDYNVHTGGEYSALRIYGGPGIAVGFNNNSRTGFFGSDGSGLDRDNNPAFGVRLILGLDIIPRPFEFFMEGGPLIGLSPGFGTALDLAVGVRLYL